MSEDGAGHRGHCWVHVAPSWRVPKGFVLLGIMWGASAEAIDTLKSIVTAPDLVKKELYLQYLQLMPRVVQAALLP